MCSQPSNEQSIESVGLTSKLVQWGTLLCLVATCSAQSVNTSDLPQPRRELRAVWVATVVNIDWPSAAGLTVDQQQAEMVRILDRARDLNLNAIILQVRPAADAFYESRLEPWSPYLTGVMGKAPRPFYDPLQFAVAQAHQRGLELHAWFNPYRARHKTFSGQLAGNHPQRAHPDFVKEYDGYLWLDPGNPRATRHSLDVILDVVRRYDIDGVHLDDYFYPYPIQDEQKREVPFPDADSYAASGADQGLADWRRANVDRFVRQLYAETKAAKPHVKVGISPFGIWRPGHPASIQGFDAYDKLYADSRKWLQHGWVDYLTPQLYWPIDSPGQSYPKLLDWWIDQNTRGRLICPGNFASKVDRSGTWPAQQIIDQIRVTREAEGASGNVLFSMKSLFDDFGPLGDALRAEPYQQPALVPAANWLNVPAPARPLLGRATAGEGEARSESQLELKLPNDTAPWLWVVRRHVADGWQLEILPGQEVSLPMAGADRLVVTAVNRVGAEGPPATYPERAEH